VLLIATLNVDNANRRQKKAKANVINYDSTIFCTSRYELWLNHSLSQKYKLRSGVQIPDKGREQGTLLYHTRSKLYCSLFECA
jgi:hypothetical protein